MKPLCARMSKMTSPDPHGEGRLDMLNGWDSWIDPPVVGEERKLKRQLESDMSNEIW